MNPTLPILVADIFDRLRLQLPDPIVNWLTPVWILCVGAAAGLILTAALWGIFWLLSRIPAVGTLAERPAPRRIAILLLTIVFFLVLSGLYIRFRPAAAAAAPRAAAAQPANPIVQRFDRALALGGCLVAGWIFAIGVVMLSSKKALDETNIALREGVLWPLCVTALVMAGCAVFGLFIVRKPMELLDSLARWPAVAVEPNVVVEARLDAPPSVFEEPAEQIVDVNFRRDEIRSLAVESDQRVKLRSEPFTAATDPSLLLSLNVPANVPVNNQENKPWLRKEASANPFRQPVVTKLYAKNYGTSAANLKLTVGRDVANPEIILVPIMAFGMAAVFFAYLLQRAAMPKLAAVALATTKSDIAQPLYAILMAVGIFGLIVFVFIPYNTFGDDIKQLKDSGLSLILILCILQSVWAASTSVADEVEGKTALTVLSKPVSRRDFIIGKFVGIAWSAGLMVAIFGVLLLVTVAYKPIYDYREGGYEINHQQMNNDPTWHDCHREMVQTVPGIVLAYLEVLVIAALSVAISTRLPAIANFLISFAIYVLGHLTPLLVQSQVVAEQLPPVVFFGRLIATVLPVLDHFNIQASVAAGIEVPPEYLAWSLVYCVLYSAVAMLLALTLFEDRDLA